MSTILDKIIETKVREVAEAQAVLPEANSNAAPRICRRRRFPALLSVAPTGRDYRGSEEGVAVPAGVIARTSIRSPSHALMNHTEPLQSALTGERAFLGSLKYLH